MPKINPATGLREGLSVAPRDPATGMPAQHRTEFQKGLRSGLSQVGSIASGVEGAARAVAGDYEGADAATMEAQRQQEEASKFGPSVSNVSDIDSIDDFVNWASGVAGQQLPIMGTMLAGAPAALGVRGAVKAALPKATVPGAGATAMTGMVGSATGVETGSIFPEINLDPVARENLNPRERAMTAITGGAIAGGLEALPFVGIAKRFGLGKSAQRVVEKSLAKEVGKGAGFQAAAEAGTEAAQTIVERAAVKFANENKDIFGEEGVNEILNAAAAGALLGGGLGGVGGVSSYLSDSTRGGVDKISETIKDIEASDEVAAMKARMNLDKFKQRFPDNPNMQREIDGIMAQDLEDPMVRDDAIKFSQALTEISTTEDVLNDLDMLDRSPEQMNDIMTLSEYARDPEQIDTDIIEELDKRYGSAKADVFDILDQIRLRLDPEGETKEAGEAAITGFTDEIEGTGGKELEADFETSPTYVTDVEFRKTREAGPTFKAAEALTSAQATEQLGKLTDDTTGIALTDPDTNEVTSGGYVYSKVPLSESVVEMAKAGKTQSLDIRGPGGRRVNAEPMLVSEGGKVSTDKLIAVTAKRIAESKSNKDISKALGQQMYDDNAVQAAKRQAISDPKKFLSNFYVIKKQKMVADTAPIVAASAEDTAVTLSKLDVSPTNDPKIKKSIIRNIPAKGLTDSRAMAEVPVMQIVRDKETGKPKRAEQQKNLSVNFPSLVSRVLTQRAKATATGSKGYTNDKNIASALREGIASMFADHGIVLSNISKIPDNTVVFYHGRKVKNEEGNWEQKHTTFGDIREYLKESVKEQRAQPDYHVGVEGKRRATNQAAEDALIELFEANKTGTGEFEGGFTLQDIGRADVAKFIDNMLTGGIRKTRQSMQEDVKPAKGQGSDTGKKIGKPVKKAAKKKRVPRGTKKSGAVGPRQAFTQTLAAVKAGNVKAEPLHADVQTTLKDLKKRFDLKNVKLMSNADAARALLMSGRADAIQLSRSGSISFSNAMNGFTTYDGQIFVNPNLTREAQLEVLSHELGHNIAWKHLKGSAKDKLQDSFEAWRETAKEGTYAELISSKTAFNLAVQTIGNRLNNNTGKLDPRIKELSQIEQEYLLDFEEWFADHTARYITNPMALPKNSIERMFKKIANALRDLFKNFKGDADANVEKFLRSLETRISNTIQEQSQENFFKRAVRNLKGIKMSGQTRAFIESGEGIGAYITASDINNDEARTAIARWINAALTQQERRALTDAFSQPANRKKIEEITGSMVANPLQSVAVGIQLWNMGKIELGPKTTPLMNRFVRWVKQWLGIPTTEQKAESIANAIIQARISTQVDHRTYHLKEVYRDDLLARAANVVHDQGSRMFGYLESFTYTADSRMQNVPALQEIASMFHARVGKEGDTAPSYFEDRATNVGKFTDRVERIFEGMDDAAKARILEDAQQKYSTDTLSDSERVASNALRKLFEDMYKYAEKNGVSTMIKGKDADGNPIRQHNKIKHRKEYFPILYDMQYLMDNRDKFIKMLSQDKYKRYFKEEGTGPEGIYQHLVDNMGYGDTTPTKLSDRVSFSPAMSAVNQRTLDWIKPEDRAPFLNKSLEYTMVQYIDSLVKRSEYTKRFDTDGRYLEDLLAKAKFAGATDAELKTAEHYIEAALGSLGRETNQKLYGLFGKTPTPGQVINPSLQKAMSSIIVVRNLAILGLSAFTSLADVVGISVRSGRMVPWEAYKQGLEEIRNGVHNMGQKDGKKARSVMSEMARGLGVIDTHMTNEALEFQYGGTYMSSGLKKINEAFFKAIMLTQLTQLTRVMALASAKNFVKMHYKMENDSSKRFMKELGIEEGDVQFDNEGELIILTRAGREVLEGEASDGNQESADALARDDRVRNGLFRWVDGAILRPNAAQRPIWASDPHYMLFFHLKSFMYSFHDRILRRVWTEAAKHGNYMPAMAVMLYMPAMVAIDAARDWLKYGFGGSPRKANWGMGDYMENAANRAGLYGVAGTMVMDARSDREFGGVGFENMLGAVNYPARLTSAVVTGNSAGIERALPLNSVWRNW